jgi:FHS family L-fucose permease-like MFS transporter
MATVIAPIVASYAFFGGGEDSGTGDLESVKWTYVGVGCGKLEKILHGLA